MEGREEQVRQSGRRVEETHTESQKHRDRQSESRAEIHSAGARGSVESPEGQRGTEQRVPDTWV